jgi:hypothetical protein
VYTQHGGRLHRRAWAPAPCHFTRLSVDPASGMLLASDGARNHLCYALRGGELVGVGGAGAALQSSALLPLPDGCITASPSGELTVRALQRSATHRGTSCCNLAPRGALDLGAATLHLAPIYTAAAAAQPLQRGAAGLLQATGAAVMRVNSRGVALPAAPGERTEGQGQGQGAPHPYYQLPPGTPGCVAGTLLGGLVALQPLGQHELTWLAPLQWVMRHLLVTAPVGRPLALQPSGRELQLERFLDLDLLLQYTGLPLALQLRAAELVRRLLTLEEVGRPGAGPLPAQELRLLQREWLGARAARAAGVPAEPGPAIRLHLTLLMTLDAVAQRCTL